MSRSLRALRQKAETWLRQGISPRRLALTLALGFAIGCIPVIGIPTAVCLVVALSLRLNIPAIQAANYAAMPFKSLSSSRLCVLADGYFLRARTPQ